MKRKTKIRVWAVVASFMIIGLVACLDYWRTFQMGNVISGEDANKFVRVYRSYSYEDLLHEVEISGAVKNMSTFRRAARHMKLASGFKPGYYVLREGMNNKAIVRMLLYGWQSPIEFSFSGYIRTLDKFAAVLGSKLEADSSQFARVLLDTAVMNKYGFEPESFIGMFIPNTYEVYWTIEPETLVERLHKEYLAFWNEERKAKAKAAGLSQKEVSTLASIVISETKYEPEMPRIAGVYINRLRKGILLQADPTVVYACNTFGIRRVLNKHLKIDSPYNTYRYKGLPPGPITMSPVVAIDAVLNYEHHKYIFFCARETFDGQHNFAETLSGHLSNARAYHKALNLREKAK